VNLALIVILNGAIVPSVPPAQLLFGHVMVPVAPVVTQFTQRAAVDGDTITLVRQGRTCVFRIGSDAFVCDGVGGMLPVAPFGRDGMAYVPLADVVRAFGGDCEYDPRSRMAAVDVPPETALKTPGAVRSQCTVGDADDGLHALARADTGNAASRRRGESHAAPHRDPG